MDVMERGSNKYVRVSTNDDIIEENIELKVQSSNPETDLFIPKGDDHTVDRNQKLHHENKDDDTSQVNVTCLDKCTCSSCLLLIGSVATGLMSVVFDWLWVADMLRAEKALVFGPPSTDIYIALIVMSSLGTVTFICEDGDKIYKFFTKKDIFDEQAEELLSLFFEEVPEITLNLLLSMCREIPTSYFQLIKAGLAIASSALRLIKATCYALGCKKTKPRKRKLRAFGRFILIAACIYTLAAGITVFVFMYMEPNQTGQGAAFNLPANVFGKAYNTERYFPKSGVFFTHPSLDHCQDSKVGNEATKAHRNWIRIEVMYTYLLLGESSLEAAYCYNETSAVFHVKSRRQELCYELDLSQCLIKSGDGTSCHIVSNATTLYMVFHRKPMTRILVFGDVKYNATLTVSDQCSFVTGDSFGRMFGGNKYMGQLQYFKALYSVNISLPVVYNNMSAASFYQYPEQLVNISEAWRTGYKDCDMSGALAPNPHSLTNPECVTWVQP